MSLPVQRSSYINSLTAREYAGDETTTTIIIVVRVSGKVGRQW